MPTVVSSVEIPLTGESVNYVLLDQAGNPLNCTAETVSVGVVPAGTIQNPTPLNSNTSPSLTFTNGSMEFAAGSATAGQQYAMTFTYLPANQAVSIPAAVGTPITSIQVASEP